VSTSTGNGECGIPRFRGGIVDEETRCQSGRKYDAESREGAVTIVRETGRPIAEVARDLGVGAGTLGNWVHQDRITRGDGPDRTRVDAGSVRRLEREAAEARMERDVLERSVVRR
jgi:transposase